VPPTTQFKHRRAALDSYKLGIITDVSQVGGYPNIKAPPIKTVIMMAYQMSTETKNGLNPKNAEDASLYKKSGYTNIEEYLNILTNKKA
jgi:hypothetical protein